MTIAKYTILVVDEDSNLLNFLSLRLTGVGCTVITATSGEEALAEISRQLPHLVIAEMCLPGMDGLALADVILEQHPTLSIILLTAYGLIPAAVAATARGVFRFVIKPFEIDDLMDQVEQALHVGRAPHEAESSEVNQSWRTAIITRSPLMEDLLDQARLVAAHKTSVLIQGARGTGKELLAQAIHNASSRSARAFVPINCGAIPETLLQAELFGYVRGAFTGAVRSHQGLIQAADGGTLFLDEIGDMPLNLQVQLLRVLVDQKVQPVGAACPVSVDIRLISATHQELNHEMNLGTFRADLYYRLNVVQLNLPPLTARREDIPLLARSFLSEFAARSAKEVHGFAPEALEMLMHAPWPGNVRQLRNVVEQTVALTITPLISATLVRRALREPPQDVDSFRAARERFVRNYLVQILRLTNGNVRQAARLAQLSRQAFYQLLQRHQVNLPEFRQPPF